MIRTEMLRAFVVVVRAGGLVEGASQLSRTPSAVSSTLKQLEEHLGQPLFEPGRKNRPTALGRFVFEEAERGLRHHARTIESIEGFAAGRAGDVRVAAVPSYAMHRLPQITRAFLDAYPGVRLDIHDMDSRAVLQELLAERVDVGVASDPPADARLVRRVLNTDRFGVVVRKDSPYARRASMRWASLDGTSLLPNALSERIDAVHELAAPTLSSLRVHTTGTLLAMVRAGFGPTILPELVTEQAGDELVFVPLERPVVRRELCLLWLAREAPSPPANGFINFVTQR